MAFFKTGLLFYKMDYMMDQGQHTNNFCRVFASCPFDSEICWSRDPSFQERNAFICGCSISPVQWTVRLPLGYFWLLRTLKQLAGETTVLFGITDPSY